MIQKEGICQGHVLFCDVGLAYIFSPHKCCFKVISDIEDEDMLIANRFGAEVKLVRFAKPFGVAWFNDTALFKGLGK